MHALRVARVIINGGMTVQVVDGDLDKRKSLSEELRNLQRRLKQCAPAAPPCNHDSAFCRLLSFPLLIGHLSERHLSPTPLPSSQ